MKKKKQFTIIIMGPVSEENNIHPARPPNRQNNKNYTILKYDDHRENI